MLPIGYVGQHLHSQPELQYDQMGNDRPNAILGGFMNLAATCECGTEYDLNYVEYDGGASFSYDACPDCGIQLDRETVAEAINAD